MFENLSIFGFRAMWSPWLLSSLIVIGIVYGLLIKGVFSHKNNQMEKGTQKQLLLFITALVLLYIIKGSPFDLLSHLNFSIHMLQMSILYFILPPLLMYAIPVWVYRKMLSVARIKMIFSVLTKPLIAVLFFNGVFSLYHFPFIFDWIKTNSFLHAFVNIFIFIAAFFMWWPLISPLSEYRSLNGLQKLAYIFADGVLLTPACALIIFADAPLYQTYTDPTSWLAALQLCVPPHMLLNLDIQQPQLFSWLPPLQDQQLGGVIMKIMQELIYGVALGVVFFQWAKDERQKDSNQLYSSPNPQE